jgi:hypothetical protein
MAELVNDELERILRQSVMAQLYVIYNLLEGPEENNKNLSHDRQCVGQDSNHAPHEYLSPCANTITP